jgi:two-component sensor histidine kinase
MNRATLVILCICLTISLFCFLILGLKLYLNNRQKNKDRQKIEEQHLQLIEISEKINAQNKRNELLLKELHHRVKNNLQVIYSLLNLQKRRNDDEDIKDILSSVQNRIHTMSLVHQNLYLTGNFENADINLYIQTIIDHLHSLYLKDKKNIEIQLLIEHPIHLKIEKALSIGLILNEAISNSFKYAFKNRTEGHIGIQINSTNNVFSLLIKDDGPGFMTHPDNENSLGMKLISVMCDQLKAAYKLQTTNGVSYNIEFKI